MNTDPLSKQIDLLDQFINIQQLQKSIEANEQNENKQKDYQQNYPKFNDDKQNGQDTIMFLGNTGVGISTTIRYLCEAKMIEKEVQVSEMINGELVSAQYKVIDSVEQLDASTINHCSASKSSCIKFIPIPSKPSMVFYDAPGFDDSRGATENLSNTFCLNKAISLMKKLRIVLLFKFQELEVQRGKLIRDLVQLISSCFKQGNFVDHISKIQVHYTHARGKSLKNDILPILLTARKEIKPEEPKAVALINHIIKLACPAEIQESQIETKKSNKQKTKFSTKNQDMAFRSMIIDPLNPLQRLELLDMICKPNQTQFENPGEILEFKPNELVNNNIKLFTSTIQNLVLKSITENKYELAFQVLEKTKTMKNYIKQQEVANSISEICEAVKLSIEKKQNSIKNNIEQTLDSKAKFNQQILAEIDDYIRIIKLWDEKKKLYFDTKQSESLNQEQFNECIYKVIKDYSDKQLIIIKDQPLTEKINFFTSFCDQLSSLNPPFGKLLQIQKQIDQAKQQVIQSQVGKLTGQISTFLPPQSLMHDENVDKNPSELSQKIQQLDQIVVSFDELRWCQTKLGISNQNPKQIFVDPEKDFAQKIKDLSASLSTELKKSVSYFSGPINIQSSTEVKQIKMYDLQYRMEILQITAKDKKTIKLFPSLTKTFVQLIKDCNAHINNILQISPDELEMDLEQQNAHQLKFHFQQIDNMQNFVSNLVKSLDLQDLQDISPDDIDKKYRQFKFRLQSTVNNIVEQINKLSMILKNLGCQNDASQQIIQPDRSDPNQQQRAANVNQISNGPTMKKLYIKLQKKIVEIKNLDWMDSYFNPNVVSKSLKKAEKRFVSYLESVINKINSLILGLNEDAALWHQIADQYFHVHQIKKLGESMKEVDLKVKECTCIIEKRLESLEKDCLELEIKLQNCSLNDSLSMKKLNFTIEQLKYISDFSQIDTIVSKVQPHSHKLSEGWYKQITVIYYDIRKIRDGNEFRKKNREELEKINSQLDMLKQMQEFKELKSIMLPLQSQNNSLYEDLKNILNEYCNDVNKISKQHISNKEIQEAEIIDQFFEQSFKTLKNHLPDIDKYRLDYNELSQKISVEIEDYFKQRKWQLIADFLQQNTQIVNRKIHECLERVNQDIVRLHDTEFKSLESMIRDLGQDSQDKDRKIQIQQKVELIDNLKKYFVPILNIKFYKKRENQLHEILAKWINDMQENIEQTRAQKKFLQMYTYQLRYETIFKYFGGLCVLTEENVDLDKKFEIQFKNNFTKQEIDQKANDFMKLLEELKQIIDESQKTNVRLLRIYKEKYDRIIESIELDMKKKVEIIDKLLNQLQLKEAQKELAHLKSMTKKFESYITYDEIIIQDIESQLQDPSQNIIISLLSQIDSIEDPKEIQNFNNEIRKKYNISCNQIIHEQLKQQFVKIFTEILKNLTQLLNRPSPSHNEISAELNRLIKLTQLSSICEDLKPYVTKLQDVCQLILSQLGDQLDRYNQSLGTMPQPQEEINYQFSQCLKMIIKIREQLSLSSDTQTQIKIKQSIISINLTLSKQIRDAYYRFGIHLDNLHINEIYKSLDELKKLNPIIDLIKKTDELQLKELGLIGELIAYKTSDDIQTYEVAKESVEKVISGLENELRNHFKAEQYRQYAKELMAIEELEKLKPSQTNKYKELFDEFTHYLENLACQMTENINQCQLDKKLQKMFSQIEKMSDQMNNVQDISTLTQNKKNGLLNQLGKVLDEQFHKFKKIKPEAIDIQGNMLIKITQSGDDVPIIKINVQSTIKLCLDHVISNQNQGCDSIFKLWKFFQKSKDSFVCNQIITTNPQFSPMILQDRQQKTEATNKPDIILSQFKLLSDSNNSFNSEQKQMFLEKKYALLKQEQKKQLETMFNNYRKKYNDLIETYTKKKFGHKEEILVSIKKNIEFKYQIENWNDCCKNNINDLFALVSAYWSLMGINNKAELKTQKSPHASQICSIMFLLGFDRTDAGFQGGTNLNQDSFQNQVIQILTGEGKSLVLGLLAALLALIGYDVDVACYSKYLSQRDLGEFSPLFTDLGIQHRVSYGTFRDLSEKIINKAGDIREISKNLLEGVSQQLAQESKTRSILLIDEVDVFFSSDFYGQTYNPVTLFQNPHLEHIMETLWKNRILKNVQLSIDLVKQSTQYISLIQQYPRLETLFSAQIELMAQATGKIREHEYVVVNGKIGYKVGKYSDQISTDISYGYSTNFAYFQEFDRGNVTLEEKKKQIGINLQCGSYSYIETPKKYINILGVTGTLETLHEESLGVISKYFQVMSAVPSQFGDSKLSFDKAQDIRVEMDEDSMFLILTKMIQKGLKKSRPVLVFFRETEAIYRFQKSNHFEFEDVIIIEPKCQNVVDLIAKSIRRKQLVLLDRVFGRGTDFLCMDELIDEQGGVLVIQTFLSLEMSEEVQIRGRTARQSRKGKYRLILNAKDLEDDFHIKPEETKQKSTNTSNFYDYLLKQQRQKIWSEQLKKMAESIVSAYRKHKKTEKFHKLLAEKRNDRAMQMLIEFNFGKIRIDKSSFYHFIFCLDDSGSMDSTDGTQKTRWQQAIDAVQQFVQERDDSTDGISQDIVSIIYYSSYARVISQYSPINNVMEILNQNLPSFGGTYFFYAINLISQILQAEPTGLQDKKKAVLFLSDGQDGGSNTELVNSINSLIQVNNTNIGKIVSWQNMGFGPDAEASVLQQMTQLCARCGGKYVQALNAEDLENEFNDLAYVESQNHSNHLVWSQTQNVIVQNYIKPMIQNPNYQE